MPDPWGDARCQEACGTCESTCVTAEMTLDCVKDKPAGSGDIRDKQTISFTGNITVRFLNCQYAYTTAADGEVSVQPVGFVYVATNALK